MRQVFILLFLLACQAFSPAGEPAHLGRHLQARYNLMQGGETAVILITLRDKGPGGRAALFSATDLLSPRSIARRARVRKGAPVIDEQDLPLDEAAVRIISGIVTRTRHRLKWFNAVSAEATRAQIDELARLPFVTGIELVGRWKGVPERETANRKTGEPQRETFSVHRYDYGASLTQVDQITVPAVHDLGIEGEGVVVGVFDNGFRLLSHETFAAMNIIAQYDFVDHKESVVPNAPQAGFGSHGINTLSTVGGFTPGQLIGPAFKADFILARTENDSSETPVEEDNWAAAIEWADSIGVDVTTTSLGYLDYTSPYTSWTWEDMDGNTTIITRAADHAVSLGIVVVNSAGNNGSSTVNTLNAPADGDSVIAAGGVLSSGARWSSSSIGPTTDVPPRIKPDVMAMSSGVRVASGTLPTGYGYSSGTSFSSPLVAGVAALILSANPGLGPLQVRDALRNTANNAATPDNYYGWGIVNADSAIRYWGIVPMARLSGFLYHDINGNGVRDTLEPPLDGVMVSLAGPTPGGALTGIDGAFQFDSLAIGAYTLGAATAPGWALTTPAESLAVTLLHRDDVSGRLIGLFQPASVSGLVFNDLNADGALDGGEPGLEGWTVTLKGPVTDSALTDANGAWSFPGLPPGTYTVSQTPQDGWLQSFPPAYANHEIVVTAGLDTAGVAFGLIETEATLYQVAAGWNLLSLPVVTADPLADSLYPNALSPVTLYSGGYVETDTVPNGKGYWVKFPSPQNILIAGAARTLDTVGVSEGWNLIGALSIPVGISSVITDPDSLVTSKYYSFAGKGYFALDTVDSLLPHRGYWVKCRAPGILILSSP